jgi:hypothetical protein
LRGKKLKKVNYQKSVRKTYKKTKQKRKKEKKKKEKRKKKKEKKLKQTRKRSNHWKWEGMPSNFLLSLSICIFQ